MEMYAKVFAIEPYLPDDGRGNSFFCEISVKITIHKVLAVGVLDVGAILQFIRC